MPRKRSSSPRRRHTPSQSKPTRKELRPRRAAEPDEPAHVPSSAAIAGEARRTGLTPNAIPPRPEEIPGEGEMRLGDPDLGVLGNTYVGDETPGGSMMTPDQDSVDEVGRAVGVQEEDSGNLRTSSEVLDERDRRRAQQDRPDTRDRR